MKRERLRHRKHLPLAATEPAGPLVALGGEVRKHVEHVVNTFGALECQTLKHGQQLEHGMVLRRERQTTLGDFMGGKPADVSAKEPDAPEHRPVNSGDRAEKRSLPGAICSKNADELALVHVKGNVTELQPTAMPGRQILDRKDRSHFRLPDRLRSPPGSWPPRPGRLQR